MNTPTASNSEARKRHSPGVQIEGGDPTARIEALTAENYALEAARDTARAERFPLAAENARLRHLLEAATAEVAALKAHLGPCACNLSPDSDGPSETCPQHGRSREEWIDIADGHIGRANATERERDALAATAERVRALADEWESEAAEVVIDMGGCKRWSEIHASGIRDALEVKA